MRGRSFARTQRGYGSIAGRVRTATDPHRFQCLPRGDIRVSKPQEKCCDQLKRWGSRGFGSYSEGTSGRQWQFRERAQNPRTAYASRCAGLRQKPTFPTNPLLAEVSVDAGKVRTSRGLPR